MTINTVIGREGEHGKWIGIVQDPMLSRDGNQIQLDLIIKNEVNPAKATGHVWSVYIWSAVTTSEDNNVSSGLKCKVVK